MPVTSPRPSQKHLKTTSHRPSPRVAPRLPARIPAGYSARNSAPVLDLLSKHRALEPLLEELLKVFPLFFDSIERIDLRIVQDDPSTLIARVITHDTDARDRLARFDEKWWSPNEERHRGRIHATVGHA